MKATYGRPDTKYACVGYCFGAPYVCNALANDTCLVGGFGHPAFLKEHHFTNIKSELPAILVVASCWPTGINAICLGPLFMSCSEIDHTFNTESRAKALAILEHGKKDYHLQLFSGVEHGFALRGNVENPYERKYHLAPRHAQLLALSGPVRLGEGAEPSGTCSMVRLLAISIDM